MIGPAPVLDFDGTIAQLDVDWIELRRQLNVDRIDDLWTKTREWSEVTDAEVRAATTAEVVGPIAAILSKVQGFAVLTSNDARAVHRFMDRFPDLKNRLAIVVGRGELGGPKTDFTLFTEGVQKCLTATDQYRNGEQAVYVGDSSYELDFAHRLGLKAVDVKDLIDHHRPEEG
jgi:phosphoglycolate phosphatase-like HAD superfamily hydrolase